MAKHVTALVAVLAAFGVSFFMMQRAVGLGSPWLVLMADFCVLGVAKFVDPLYAMQVPAGVREVRAWELQGVLYRRLGVREFGTLLRDTPLRVLNTTVYFSANGGDALAVRRQLESAEAAHFWAGLLLVPYLAWCAWAGKWAVFAVFMAFEIVVNAYPIMHLRYVRGRLDRARDARHRIR